MRENKILTAIYAIAGIAFAMLMIHTLLNAIRRTFVGIPLPDTSEYVAGWYMPVGIMFGVVIAYLLGEHTRAGLLYQGLSLRAKKRSDIATDVVQLVFIGAIAFATTGEASWAMSIGQHYGISNVLIWPVKWLLAIAFYIMAAILLVRLIRALRPSAIKVKSMDPKELNNDGRLV